ncbi:hypothetical protein [Cytobacillus purgationiresistens]|uniref:Uncharacterized protein n=1 Tax=Cytobacillus purgationiresistens TaxID=863449 RepID=A0ABU0AE90_9BACI|nr:hypothetical protein [Cytobacillus purgationiresistens]MDQ0269194.1 hypothetical protein [Cytobacillus purgationiresistens]
MKYNESIVYGRTIYSGPRNRKVGMDIQSVISLDDGLKGEG